MQLQGEIVAEENESMMRQIEEYRAVAERYEEEVQMMLDECLSMKQRAINAEATYKQRLAEYSLMIKQSMQN